MGSCDDGGDTAKCDDILVTFGGDMSADESDDAARIVLSKLLATSDDLYTSTEYSWLVDMVIGVGKKRAL